eukprot:TRINITY_DN31484_c0_g1_i1.p1 TRINITY_DN31484_c0_g1~~TRINITY_DN31484_c0_g1_i1.p1  ORF type:complete len:131 (+),score=21.90 TRINITY_DN31484_c0_g1_i1:77-469(+)
MLWSFIAYVITPLGILVWLLQLSGVHFLEKSAGMVVGLRLSVGSLRLTLPMFIALFSTIMWISETIQLQNTHGIRTVFGQVNFETDQMHAKRWRAERNWWILNFNLLLWLTNWRANALMMRLREEKEHKN